MKVTGLTWLGDGMCSRENSHGERYVDARTWRAPPGAILRLPLDKSTLHRALS